MEIFCVGGFVLWGLCVVLLAVISAARNAPDASSEKTRANFKSVRARSK